MNTDRTRVTFALRLVAVAAVTATAWSAGAQTTPTIPLPGGIAPPKGSTTTLNLNNVPVLSQPSGMRPISQSAAQAISQATAQANAEALAQAGKLSLVSTAPLPPNCDRRIVAYGSTGSATTFTVRPGQSVVLQGCFGNAPPGEMRLNGLGSSGFRVMQVIDWKPNFVHAKVPDITGEIDKDVRLQLRFGDGDFTNELNGKFVANRAKYEISGGTIQQLITIQPMSLPAQTDFYSWGANVDAHDGGVSGRPSSLAPTGVSVHTQSPKLGSYFLKPKFAHLALHGYYASLYHGQSQFSNWGPNGEMTFDWSTSAPNNVHSLVFNKLVVEAPVGTVSGTPLPN